jgi:hypothetical protein
MTDIVTSYTIKEFQEIVKKFITSGKILSNNTAFEMHYLGWFTRYSFQLISSVRKGEFRAVEHGIHEQKDYVAYYYLYDDKERLDITLVISKLSHINFSLVL